MNITHPHFESPIDWQIRRQQELKQAKRDRRDSITAYGTLCIAVLSLSITLVTLCRPIQLNHHYTVTIPDFPAMQNCVRCDKQRHNDGNANNDIGDCFNKSNIFSGCQ